MNALSLILIVGFIVAGTASVEAAVSNKKSVSAKKTAKTKAVKKAVKTAKAKPAVTDRTRGELKTNVNFDDTVLHGQYQMPEEGLAKVETEKVLSDILGVRRHFKDRLTEASQQE